MALNPENQFLLEQAQYLARANLIPVLVPSIRLVMHESGLQPECQCYRREKCMTPGKHPVKGWKQVPMDTPLQGLASLTELLRSANPGETFNLGLRTGIVGGIFAIDIDHKPNGFSGYQNWTAFLRAKEINDPYHYATLTAETGGGGRHYVYKYPDNGDKILNAVGHPAFNFRANPHNPDQSGIDVRGDGGIIIVYPSRHKSGNFYRWLNDPATSIRENTPSAILMAVSEEPASRDPDSDYTPKKEELEALAERMIRKRKSQTNVNIGIDLKNVLAGIPIHVDSGAHEPFRDLTYRIALEWPRANAARLMELFSESIRERERLVPDGSCTHENVLNALTGALAKCREKAEHWESKLIRSRTGEGIINCFSNVDRYLRHDPLWSDLFSTNARSNRPFVLRQPPGLVLGDHALNHYPRPVIDADETHVMSHFEDRFNISSNTENVRRAIRYVADENSFDPFLQYLEKLPPWDGFGRVDTWLSVLGGAEDTPLHRAFGAIWLLQAVYRTLEPGCQADYCLILEGKQGIGKSSLLRALVPDPSLFDDGIKPIDHTAGKDNLLKLGGPVILELAELSALRKGDVEAIKAFLTAREDTYRPPYGTHPFTIRRRCVFAGTTNSDQYLRDATGNRRFFPVRLADCEIDIAQVVAHRDQIWAEALHRARNKEPAYLTRELELAAEQAQNSRKMVEPWQDTTEDWLDEAEAAIRKMKYVDLTTSNQDRFGPENAANESMAEVIEGMSRLDTLTDDNAEHVWDAEKVRRYGEIEHFCIDNLFEHFDISVDRRSPSARDSIRTVLKDLGYEKVKWRKMGEYRDKWRWLRKTQ